MHRAALASFVLFTMLPIVGSAESTPADRQKAVLVTGASTGIGRRITERLAADGYFVYAGARKEADLKALGSIKNVQAVRLDVTEVQDIEAAVETVRHGGRGLFGLVNNAGVATIGTISDMKPEEFDLVMAVNVYGPYRMTRAFEPLIAAEKGRIVNIGSISGILAGSPDLIAYDMSKHALEAFTDCLAVQMSSYGVRVSIIEPGNYNSQIGDSVTKRTGVKTRFTERSIYKEPVEVADAAEKALFETSPKRRYLVVPTQAEAEMTIKKQIQQLAQLNEGQPYSYDRAALIKMLDEALSQARPRTK